MTNKNGGKNVVTCHGWYRTVTVISFGSWKVLTQGSSTFNYSSAARVSTQGIRMHDLGALAKELARWSLV